MARYGTPAHIITDQGSAFMSQLFEALVQFSGNSHYATIPYSKQGNTRIERTQKEQVRHIRSLVQELAIDEHWSMAVPLAQRLWNATKHRDRQWTPAQLVFGNVVDLDRTTLYHPHYGNEHSRFIAARPAQQNETLNEYMVKLLDTQQRLLNAALRLKLISAHKHFHASESEPQTEFEVGQYVLVKPPEGARDKLAMPWQGPVRILERRKDAYLLQSLIDGSTKLRHVSRLKAFQYTDDAIPLQTAAKDKGEYVVEQVVKHQPPHPTRDNGLFLIKWQGYPLTETPADWLTWEALQDNFVFHDYCIDNNLSHLISKKHKQEASERKLGKLTHNASRRTPPSLIVDL
jgi:hypothetical protein